jgi:hypothetical protein
MEARGKLDERTSPEGLSISFYVLHAASPAILYSSKARHHLD